MFISVTASRSQRNFKLTVKRNKNIDFEKAKAFMCTVVNQTLPYLHGGSLEITLTVPLRTRKSS